METCALCDMAASCPEAVTGLLVVLAGGVDGGQSPRGTRGKPALCPGYGHGREACYVCPCRFNDGYRRFDDTMSGESIARNSLRIPVSVALERRIARAGPWSQVQWEAVAVVAGEESSPNGGRRRSCTRTTNAGATSGRVSRSSCSGRLRELLYNLLSERPSLFVVCFEGDEDDEGDVELFPVIG